MNKTLEYENGLRVIVGHMPGVRSVAVGFWVGAGSGNENDETNGISHFTEHVTFKGTDKLSPFDIADRFESYGAIVNAFTSKECTCYYVKTVDEYTENCVSLLSDIFFRSVYPSEELDKERKVIVEEINMNEDSPEDLCYDVISEATYGRDGFGRTVLGPAENVMRFGKTDVEAYVREYYVPSNVVVAFAGNITTEEADRLVRKYVLGSFASDGRVEKRVPDAMRKRVCLEKIKPFEQANLALAFPSLATGDPRFTAQAALNVILGGGMSSRLFQSVREKQGLAYSVYSAPAAHKGTGTFEIYLNISEKNTVRALEAVKKELDALLAGGVTDGELDRAKVQLKSALVFAEENVQSVMSSAGKLLLLQDKVFDVDEKIRQINSVTAAAVNELAAEILDYGAMNAAYVGKKTNADILGIFDRK